VDPRLWRASAALRRFLAATTVCGLVISGCAIGSAILLAHIASRVITDPAAHTLSQWAPLLSILLAVWAARAVAHWLQARLGQRSASAVIADRTMSRVGLNGKSFIPLLSAYACAVPAIMATRTIESKRDRIATILIAPFMTCSARLPIYILVIAAFIPHNSWYQVIALLGLSVSNSNSSRSWGLK